MYEVQCSVNYKSWRLLYFILLLPYLYIFVSALYCKNNIQKGNLMEDNTLPKIAFILVQIVLRDL